MSIALVVVVVVADEVDDVVDAMSAADAAVRNTSNPIGMSSGMGFIFQAVI